MLDPRELPGDAFRAGIDVRLLSAFDDVPAGTIGRLLGFFRYPDHEDCLVEFGERSALQIGRDVLEPA